MPPPVRAPALADLLSTKRWLSFGCTLCGRSRLMSPFEACHRFGHDLRIDEVRALIRARCRSRDCAASVGLALEHETPGAARR